MTLLTAFEAIATERQRQDQKWGPQNHDTMVWSAVLGEEFGEACQEALRCTFDARHLDDHTANLRKELVEVVAVAVAWIECLDRGEWE